MEERPNGQMYITFENECGSWLTAAMVSQYTEPEEGGLT
jgi:hypothetical protein